METLKVSNSFPFFITLKVITYGIWKLPLKNCVFLHGFGSVMKTKSLHGK